MSSGNECRTVFTGFRRISNENKALWRRTGIPELDENVGRSGHRSLQGDRDGRETVS
jgi:hypothetical protein